MGSAANKLVPVSGVVKYVSPLDSIEAIMWLRKPSDIEPEWSQYEGNEDFLNKLIA